MEEKYTISVSRIISRILFKFAPKIAYTGTVVASVLCWLYSLSYVLRFKIEMPCCSFCILAIFSELYRMITDIEMVKTLVLFHRYDFMLTYSLEWPSLTCQWMPQLNK